MGIIDTTKQRGAAESATTEAETAITTASNLNLESAQTAI